MGPKTACRETQEDLRKRLGPIRHAVGRYLDGHIDFINILKNGTDNLIYIRLPRKLVQFDDPEPALEKGLVPDGSPGGWSIGRGIWQPRIEYLRFIGYEAELVLDTVDVPDSAIGYVASVVKWRDQSVNQHFNISAQWYKKKE